MPKYMLAYRGGKQPETPEQGAAQMERWKNWLADLGDAVINPGTPLPSSKIVSKSGISDNTDPDRFTGFSVVEADDLESALAMAKACPFLDMGDLEVAEMIEMSR